MTLSDCETILIVVVILVIIAYFVLSKKESFTHNEGALTFTPAIVNQNSNDMAVTQDSDVSSNASSNSSATDFKRKMTTRNTSSDGEFVKSSYSDGRRGAKSDSLDKFFEGNNPIDSTNNGFKPSGDDGNYAAYSPDKNQKVMTEKDKFNADSLMPKEKNGDWFDDPYESTVTKSSKLINIYRPIGVNSVTVNKNAGHDIRGTVPNPKFNVSPWGNSSYEPDNNIRSQGLC